MACGKRFMLGNHAIAQGFLEAGISVAMGYPGTPSSEIMEYLMEEGGKRGIYAEWSSNEKVALEGAYGAAMTGARAIATMKHVGLNVGMDPLMSSAYTGVEGGLAIVTADDPGMWSSQNEQDNRWVGLHAYIPVLEPYDPANAKELAQIAMEFSEKMKHPVLFRTVTRVSHTRGPVYVCDGKSPVFGKGIDRTQKRFALVPANARKLKAELVGRWAKIEEAVEELPVKVEEGDPGLLVITSGSAFAYVMDSIKELEISPTVINLSVPVPVQRRKVLDLATKANKIIVVEEGDPVVETQIKAVLFDEGIKVPVLGKSNFVSPVGELSIDITNSVLAGAMGIEAPRRRGMDLGYEPPQRPPVFCPGCPHAASYYELKLASTTSKVKPLFSGDIGCYSLGINPPFDEEDVLTDMGSSLGVGMGINRGTNGRSFVVSIIGDSTFFHSGLPALASAIYNKTPLLLIVLDNRTTAMTGGQPNPTQAIPIEEAVRGLGVRNVYSIDPFNVKEAVNTMRNAIDAVKRGETAVVVSKRACALEAARKLRREGVEPLIYSVVEDACKACGICYNMIACPAIQPKDDGRAWIDPNSCVGCSVCAQVCPYDAIKPSGNLDWIKRWGETL
ncbi:indolepyruvate ferredoxin oxidoreductase [Thermocladium modestius]|uniref:Indolepyruvate oxidoreductase subunit IorA n=1 Tax=Thermocladium modestius TaxID=62609 RepID=A0A830GXJ4_9CREN|nr:indolepyruvate ferredoxin oxidoreductase subunit alpha [Thermocladium modestius]GGP20262.1 indolepyruvate ferredoxin oxidoreductase [Thermocladium modestius]